MYRPFSFVVPVALVCALAAGCAPSKGDIEKSIREEMKTSLNVDVAAVNLTKQPDGSYVGTATAANGDVYDVTTNPPQGARIEWKAIPSQAMVERDVRAGVESHYQVKVKTLSLTKKGPGTYNGTVEFENGTKMSVSTSMEGKQLVWKTEPLF
jgi:hypothetical protein